MGRAEMEGAAAMTDHIGSSKRCPDWVIPWGGATVRCFGPGHVPDAESLLPFQPVDPVELIRNSAGLPLELVVVSSDGGFRPAGAPEPPFTSIAYYFGSAETSAPMPAPRTPKFLVVREMANNLQLPARPAIHRAVGESGRYGVKLKDWYGPWHLRAATPDGQLAVHVHSNLPKREIERIARALLHSADRLSA